MLKNLVPKDKGKKDPKKDGKKEGKKKKQEKKEDDITVQEQETDAGLIEITEELGTKKEDKKIKRDNQKKNQFKLDQKQIDVAQIDVNSKESVKSKPPMTTWVANSVEQVMKKDFKMEQIDHEFESLTDPTFNEKQKQKKKKVQEETVTQSGMGSNFLPLEKTTDQIMMEKGSSNDVAFIKKQQTSSISIPTTEKKFINTNMNSNFIPMQKTPQELRMEEMERQQKERQANLPPPKTGWLGKKVEKGEQTSKPIEFRKTPMQFINSAGSNNIHAVPLQKSEQQKKLDKKKQPELVFLSKKQIEERKKKREEKELLLKKEEK